MKKIIQLFTSLVCFTMCVASVQAATKYWDINGATPGAGGATPAGTWDTGTTANWTTSSAGSAAGTTWAADDDAVFSAGADATGDFTISVDSSTPPTAGNLTVQEGNVTFTDFNTTITLGNYTANKGIIDIANGSTATIDTLLGGGNDTNWLTKIGTGTLFLNQANAFASMGNLLIQEGTVVASNSAALGGTFTVSNGAALHLATGVSVGAPPSPIVSGNGPDNNGALRCTSPSSVTFSAGAVLGADTRIQHDGGGNFDWGTVYITGTNGGNNFNLTFSGNGVGRFRMNQTQPYNRAVDIGTGTVTKEGTCRLQAENPWICSALYFNGGDIFPRNITAIGQGSIYVGVGANSFQALPNTSCTMNQPMVLAAGSNLKFDVRTNTAGVPLTFDWGGVISGAGGLTKIQAGTLFLNAANTYIGSTIVEQSYLTLGVNGSISNSAVIDVRTDGIFNVTSNASFVLQSGQTLKGNGTVLGNVNAKGTISPGASVGSLTNNGSLTLGGSILIDVDKSLSPGSSNDLITVTGSLNHSGGASVTVVNLGPALAVGDSFQIFDKAVTGGGTITVTGGGATWANNLAANGSIAVTALAPPAVPATNVTIQAAGPTSYALGGLGAASSVYDVYAATNIAIPVSNWWKIGSTNSSAGGVIQFLDPQATNKQRFYRFGQTVP